MAKGVSDGYLQRLWRDVCLPRDHNRCIVCDCKGEDNELQVHHIVHRRRRVLRHDPQNGVTVHGSKPYTWTYDDEGHTRTLTCHEFADTLAGRELIKSKLGGPRFDYLKEREMWLVKDFLVALGMTRAELEKWELARLKKELAKYKED